MSTPGSPPDPALPKSSRIGVVYDTGGFTPAHAKALERELKGTPELRVQLDANGRLVVERKGAKTVAEVKAIGFRSKVEAAIKKVAPSATLENIFPDKASGF